MGKSVSPEVRQPEIGSKMLSFLTYQDRSALQILRIMPSHSACKGSKWNKWQSKQSINVRYDYAAGSPFKGGGVWTNLLTVVSMIIPVAPVFITEWRQGGNHGGSFQVYRRQLCRGDEEKKELTVWVRPAQTGWMNIPGGEWEKTRDKRCVQESGRVSPPSRTPEEVRVWVESTVQWGWFFFSSLQKQWGWMFIFCHLLSPDLWK